MRYLIFFTLILSGCATTAVRCDAHLRPINAPASKVVADAARQGSPS